MAVFDIHTRDAGSRARTGTLKLAHGEVRTPAFVPLATKAVVKTLEVREAAELGYDMVLGNTFHLFLTPGHELIRDLGGLHRFQRWDRPIITDSGGFQVFSMGHGAVADEIKGRSAQSGAGERAGAILSIEEQGVTFRSYLDGSAQFMGPETSMEVQAALGSDIALVFDECTPFHADREYTARSTERTHRWLDRCLAWHAEHGPRGPGRLRDRAGRRRRGPAPRLRAGGRRARRRRDRDRRHARRGQGADVHRRGVGGRGAAGAAPAAPARDRRDRRPRARRRARHRHLRLRDADPDRPPRHGRRPDPAKRWRVDLAKARWRRPTSRCWRAARARPASTATAAPTCTTCSAREQTAQRLLTIHNLAYLQRLMAGLRAAIDAGTLAEAAAAVRAGAAPWELT